MGDISDLNVHVQVAKASVFFRRCTLLKILPKIGTRRILLAPSVYQKKAYFRARPHFILSEYGNSCPKYGHVKELFELY
jgi:hypothetical protein